MIRAREFSLIRRQSRRQAAMGFTMAELLIVMGIILLFIVLAIPAINAITGTRSIAAAENNLSPLLARAREEAIGVQEKRGVLFYLDPGSGGVVGLIVRQADLQNTGDNTLLLDAVPGRDSLALPRGVGLQTMFDGNRSANNPDRYFGFNTLPSSLQNPSYPVKYGGVILFDQHGRVLVTPYGFQFQTAAKGPSALADVFHVTPPTNATAFFVPYSPNAPFSQIGAVLFDRKAFKEFSANGTPLIDDNTNLPPTNANRPDPDENTWLDTFGTAVLVNRFTGTLIRGE